MRASALGHGHLLPFAGWAIQPGRGQSPRRTTFIANTETYATAYFVDDQGESEKRDEPYHGEPAHPPDPHPPH